MKSSFARRAALAVAIAAPAAVQAASFNEPSGGYGTLSYGSIKLSWSGGDGSKVYIGLAHGPDDDLQEVTSLNGGYKYYTSNSATLDLPSSLPAGEYVFTITTEKSPENFSSSFCIHTCYPSSQTTAAPNPVTTEIHSPVPGQIVPMPTQGESNRVISGLGVSNASASPTTPVGGPFYGSNVTSFGAASSSGVATPVQGFTGGVARAGVGFGAVGVAVGALVMGAMMVVM